MWKHLISTFKSLFKVIPVISKIYSFLKTVLIFYRLSNFFYTF